MLPVDEETVARPVTTYDLHKLCAEQHLTLASTQGVLDGVSLRLANVYGPSPGSRSADERGVLNKVTNRAVQGLDLYLYGDGNYLRDYVYIGDVVRAFVAAAVQPGVSGRSFNVASGTGVTVRDAFQLVTQLSERANGKRSSVHHAAWPDDADPIEFRHFTARIDRMANACGWKPEVSLAAGIDALINHVVATSRPAGS
jgi:nucleoside-diphosphate-sugar epimerase